MQAKLTERINRLSSLPNPDKLLIQSLDSSRMELDSLKNKITIPLTKSIGKVNSLEADVNSKINSVENKINEKLKLLTGNQEGIDSINLPDSKSLGLNNPLSNVTSNLKVRGAALNVDGSIPQIGDVSTPSISQLNKPDIGHIAGLDKVQETMQGVSGTMSDVSGYTNDLKALKSGDSEQIEKTVENNLSNIDQIADVKTEMLPATKQLALMEKWNSDPEMRKEMLLNKAKEEAVNHFAGHEKELLAVMSKLNTLKAEYANAETLVDLYKSPRNSMKTKTFRERLVPGVAIQTPIYSYVNIDLNPNVAYLLSTKFSVGLGWNQRFAFDWSAKSWVKEGAVYGPRTYVDFKIPKRFSLRQEFELMNSYILPGSISPGEGDRHWIFTTMTGIKKEFRISKKVNGFTLAQFNLLRLLAPNQKSAYGNVVMARFGFEFPMKKKVRDKTDSDSSKK